MQKSFFARIFGKAPIGRSGMVGMMLLGMVGSTLNHCQDMVIHPPQNDGTAGQKTALWCYDSLGEVSCFPNPNPSAGKFVGMQTASPPPPKQPERVGDALIELSKPKLAPAPDAPPTGAAPQAEPAPVPLTPTTTNK